MRIFTNKTIQRFLIILLVVVLVFNVAAPRIIIPVAEAGIGGLLLSPLAMLIGAVLWGFQQVMNASVWMVEQMSTEETEIEYQDVFISNIVFGEMKMFNANIFDDSENANPLLKSDEGESSGILSVVQRWYGTTRIIAIAASLVTLVYVAIKIILASTGADKAKYMSLIKDWVLSLLLVFTIHYVMAAILYASQGLTDFFREIASADSFNYASIQDNTLAISDQSIIYALVWACLLGYTFVFIILYLKRLVLVCFFITIAPIVVLLHTINKLRGKSGSVLEDWLGAFVANVVMQPIDALLFSIVASSISECASKGQPLISMAFVLGFFPLRTWVTKFFGQSSEQNKADGPKGAVAGFLAGKASSMAAAASKGKVTSNVSHSGNEGLAPGASNATGAGARPNIGAGASGNATAAGGSALAEANANAAMTSGALMAASDSQAERVTSGDSYESERVRQADVSTAIENARAQDGRDFDRAFNVSALNEGEVVSPASERFKDKLITASGWNTDDSLLRNTLRAGGRGLVSVGRSSIAGTAAITAGMMTLAAGKGVGSSLKTMKNMQSGVNYKLKQAPSNIKQKAVTAADFVSGGSRARTQLQQEFEGARQEYIGANTSYLTEVSGIESAYDATSLDLQQQLQGGTEGINQDISQQLLAEENALKEGQKAIQEEFDTESAKIDKEFEDERSKADLAYDKQISDLEQAHTVNLAAGAGIESFTDAKTFELAEKQIEDARAKTESELQSIADTKRKELESRIQDKQRELEHSVEQKRGQMEAKRTQQVQELEANIGQQMQQSQAKRDTAISAAEARMNQTRQSSVEKARRIGGDPRNMKRANVGHLKNEPIRSAAQQAKDTKIAQRRAETRKKRS